MSRPEHIAPPELFYGETEAKKYTGNSRIAAIQAEMTLRAVELLNLEEDGPYYLLDIGCGSGLSGEILDEDGHIWAGMDIAPSMLDIAAEKDVEGDLFLQDIGQGMGFRPGTFDGAISVSVLQWLCNADKAENKPRYRLQQFFSTLFMSLQRGARAVFQFYPENDSQVDMIMGIAMKCGFTGGLVVDYPNSKKARKFYLCLFAGQTAPGQKQELPRGLDSIDQRNDSVAYTDARIQNQRRGKKTRKPVKDTASWILHKKELSRKRGKEGIPLDSKYTGRKRKPRF
ncbi:18S rRNA (guanine1575-N7)-methyltransferase [Coemansia spiralis]|uniref:18S rRNA (Guanine1575-N7)-methyltransferase n=2 Tax=Coemansia TaxID=4863 RepID=A0A9W8GAE9_9FUNG|nr:S-adenosyl-L-methionine-dependent methyltransferase [Coemansia spiralis]KAJ1995463.1 18S rRNA (guanine1575-N7)-methyltransferase [Coemansia umbellata]KAJ2624709.1 18S rRNA (guanine1575-N7)-methyltransferase [Coemansia sp. RSA 1358]KAJ2678251.1 18S rRNA (guanine1575-N7)-methyltransferase [Coemansia spiralis]